jgi:hypothetical protein
VNEATPVIKRKAKPSSLPDPALREALETLFHKKLACKGVALLLLVTMAPEQVQRLRWVRPGRCGAGYRMASKASAVANKAVALLYDYIRQKML